MGAAALGRFRQDQRPSAPSASDRHLLQARCLFMQIIEVSDLWVRSAAIWLRRRDTPMRFVLFPMIHVGAPRFYEEVTRRLRDCDLVVAEGIRGQSAASSALTLTYRLFGNANRDGLSVERIDYRSLGLPVVTPDMSASEFDAGWRDIPMGLRLCAWALMPLYAVGMLFAGSREMLARHAQVDDLPSRTDVEMACDDHLAPFLKLLVDDRDVKLLTALESIHEQRCNEAIQVAIVYGARHMPAVLHFLSRRLGYWACDADWMIVFER